MGKLATFFIVLFLFIIAIALIFIVLAIYDDRDITGNIISNPIKSEADECVDKYFSCIENCPTSTISSNYISHRCFSTCSDIIESQCSKYGESEISQSRLNKISCLSSCGTVTGTVKRECTINCIS